MPTHRHACVHFRIKTDNSFWLWGSSVAIKWPYQHIEYKMDINRERKSVLYSQLGGRDEPRVNGVFGFAAMKKVGFSGSEQNLPCWNWRGREPPSVWLKPFLETILIIYVHLQNECYPIKPAQHSISEDLADSVQVLLHNGPCFPLCSCFHTAEILFITLPTPQLPSCLWSPPSFLLVICILCCQEAIVPPGKDLGNLLCSSLYAFRCREYASLCSHLHQTFSQRNMSSLQDTVAFNYSIIGAFS